MASAQPQALLHQRAALLRVGDPPKVLDDVDVVPAEDALEVGLRVVGHAELGGHSLPRGVMGLCAIYNYAVQVPDDGMGVVHIVTFNVKRKT